MSSNSYETLSGIGINEETNLGSATQQKEKGDFESSITLSSIATINSIHPCV